MDIQSLPVTTLKGVGPRLAKKLERINLCTVQDVLFHLPLRYQDRTRIVPIGGLRPEMEAVVNGVIEAADVVYRKKRSLICRISDGTGSISLRFFHFSSAQQSQLKRGNSIYCYGAVRLGPMGLEMVHPEYEILEELQEVKIDDRLTPVYPTTEGVHQLRMRKLAQQALDDYLNAVTECLPPGVLAKKGWPTLKEAVQGVHHPSSDVELELLQTGKHPLQQRLAFEELLAFQLSLVSARTKKKTQRAHPVISRGETFRRLKAKLAFELTGAQERVIKKIVEDLSQKHPMQRLLQGDVGSGKTLVAAAAVAYTIEAGYQAAIMAPTELLVEQHAANFQTWFEPLDIPVSVLVGKQTARTRQAVLEGIDQGDLQVVVGTHALFQSDVSFKRLGLIVVDEQHRFGVHQRLALREKGVNGEYHPHQLIMTATPIPRTLAQTLYADLDVSIIDELPPGRQPVKTVVIPDSRRAEVVARVRKACRQGRQAYWVCPLIEESEALQLQTATDTEAVLREALPDLKVGLVHGRMGAPEKERTMQAFKQGALDVLVATTVIEVGVDVPNAALIIIENAERLGLSQLHQLRGRVGRGHNESSCVLMYQSPLSPVARKRLAVLRETNDGFAVAAEDLKLRGPGEMMGTRQTGMPKFHIADLVRDRALLPEVQEAAELINHSHPQLVAPLLRRWLNRKEHYSSV